MKKIFLTLLAAYLSVNITTAQQGVAINSTATAPDASAMLDISSTSKGMLIPRMTVAKRAAIVSPATGLQVYQTDATKGFYYFDGNVWTQLGAGAANLTGWSTTGNNAIDPLVNFIGTKDASPFIGKANGEQVFRFSSVSNNTLLGYQANHADSTGGVYNHVIGFKTGFNNTGSFNHLEGYQAGYNNTGNNNQFIGYNAGFSNTIGYDNVFIGSAAGYSNLDGAANHFVGYQAGYHNTAGSGNYFDGPMAGFNNVVGNFNHFSGYQAGYSSTNTSYNFMIGTQAGLHNLSDHNHFTGIGAGYSNVSGTQNYFSGYESGYNNVDGSQNYFSGYQAGYSNTANYNNFIGDKAGYSNSSGTDNMFIGMSTGFNNTTGSRNMAIGTGADANAIVANETMSIGFEAGFNNIASYNTFIGFEAGTFNTAGYYNHFIGYRSGYTNTTGINNHFDGYKAGALNTTGSYNNFVGNQAGYSNTTGSSNLAFGYKAGFSNTIGENNIFHGLGSGFSNVSGSNNTYIGQSAGHENVSGSGNVALGNYAGYNETGSNKLYIANAANTAPLIYGEFDNQLVRATGIMEVTKTLSNSKPVLQLKETNDDFVRLTFTNTAAINTWIIAAKPQPDPFAAVCNFNYGGSDILSLNGYGLSTFFGEVDAVSVYEYSDQKLKEKITPLKNSLSNILKLNSYNYYWKDKSKDSTLQTGFIAQELEELYPNLVHTSIKGVKAVSYTHMVPVLADAIKEQQTMIDELKLENQSLKKDIETIKAKLGL